MPAKPETIKDDMTADAKKEEKIAENTASFSSILNKLINENVETDMIELKLMNRATAEAANRYKIKKPTNNLDNLLLFMKLYENTALIFDKANKIKALRESYKDSHDYQFGKEIINEAKEIASLTREIEQTVKKIDLNLQQESKIINALRFVQLIGRIMSYVGLVIISVISFTGFLIPAQQARVQIALDQVKANTSKVLNFIQQIEEKTKNANPIANNISTNLNDNVEIEDETNTYDPKDHKPR